MLALFECWARGFIWGVLVMIAVAVLYRISPSARDLTFSAWREKLGRAWKLDVLEQRTRLKLVAQSLSFVFGLGWSYLTLDPREGLLATMFAFGYLAVCLRAKRVLDLAEQPLEALRSREAQARQAQ